jgi:D-tyrosyl-tRNA(Tyr) deacylase
MRLLLKSSDDIVLTADLVEVAAENKESGGDIIKLLLWRENLQIAYGATGAIAKWFGVEIMRLLLDRQSGRGQEDDVKITEEVVKTAAEKSPGFMKLLLDRRGDDVKITKEVVKAAAANWSEKVMMLLLDRRGDDVKITEEVVKAAAKNWSEKVMMLLLDRRGDDVKITEEVVKAAAENPSQGVMMLLLDRRGTMSRSRRMSESG